MPERTRMKKDYDPEFRAQAAKLVLIEKMGICAVAKDLGIPVTSLHSWIQKFRKGIWSLGDTISGNVTEKKAHFSKKMPSSSQKQPDRLQDLEGKNRDLEIKLRRMTMERDVLKKAMAYCLDVPK